MRTSDRAAAALADVVTPAPRDRWTEIALGDPSSLADQFPEWTAAACATGRWRDASRLYEMADGRQFVLPLLRRRGTGVASSFPDGWGIGGLVGAGLDAAAVRAVLEDARGSGSLSTRIRPDPVLGDLWADAAAPGVVRIERRAHVLDLTGGEEVVWNDRLQGSVRRGVGKAERSGVTVERDTDGRLLPVYQALFEKSLARWAEASGEPYRMAMWRGRRRDPIDKWRAIAEHLGERFRLWMAWKDARPAAATIVLLGNTAHDTRGVMDKEVAAKARASDLLQWTAMRDAIAWGCSAYHQGETGSSESLAAFKERMGGRPFDYAEYRLERLPVTRLDALARAAVKRVVGFRED